MILDEIREAQLAAEIKIANILKEFEDSFRIDVTGVRYERGNVVYSCQIGIRL